MVCSKELSVVVGPGVDFSQLVWSAFLIENVGTGIGNWISPGAGGTGPAWNAQASATIAGGTNRGRVAIDADMVYAGPNRSCQGVLTITNNENLTQPGITTLTMSFFVNSILITSLAMVHGFSGTMLFPFTAQAGAMKLRMDMVSNTPGGTQSNPLVITCAGVFENL